LQFFSYLLYDVIDPNPEGFGARRPDEKMVSFAVEMLNFCVIITFYFTWLFGLVILKQLVGTHLLRV